MYHQFNIQHFYVLPTQCTFVFCLEWIPLHSINWLVFRTKILPLISQWLLYIQPGQYTHILRLAHRMNLCVLYGPEINHGLVPYTALNDWFYNNFYPLEASCYYIYYWFGNSQILLSAHTGYFIISYGSENKKGLFSYTDVYNGD
jgi:hypothetical protein